MVFCVNCGEKVTDDAKFCQKCGIPVAISSTNIENLRQQEFSGKIYKCPNCGEVLNSFISNCPSCRFELRGTKVTSAVKEFASKLEAIEARREYVKPLGVYMQAAMLQHISKTDEQKISLIKNFSVPNTKEDILEFLILATSNVDMDIYSTIMRTPTAGEKALTEAWNAKIKQVFAKAKNTFSTDSDFMKIQVLFDSCNADIKKHKKKKVIKSVLFLGLILMLIIAPFPAVYISRSMAEVKELSNLDAMVVEVQNALDRGEFKLALATADSIDYQRYDVKMERKWDIQREYWVEKVLEKAASNDIKIDYVPSEDVDNSNKDTSSSSQKGE